jgi:hypothetical protein
MTTPRHIDLQGNERTQWRSAFQKCEDEHSRTISQLYDARRIWKTYFWGEPGLLFLRIVLVPLGGLRNVGVVRG